MHIEFRSEVSKEMNSNLLTSLQFFAFIFLTSFKYSTSKPINTYTVN